MNDRLKKHFSINTRLSLMSNKRLKAAVASVKLGDGWGQNGVIEIDGQRVFVKRIPLTDLEVTNAYSTKNHYRIPTWYNYGVGSAGFGAFRELAAHQKTSNWVRAGQCTAFPLLHHHRLVSSGANSESFDDLDGYVTYWNGSKSIERYMRERTESKQHLLLFLEYLTPLSDWMVDNPSKLAGMLPKALKSIDFLHQNGMIHFDAHLYNWLTDGRELFLTDFGLVLDREFELTKSELVFFEKHRFYDYTQVIGTFGNALLANALSLNTSQQELVKKEMEKSSSAKKSYWNTMIGAAFSLHEKKSIALPQALIKYFQKYQAIITEKNSFMHDLCESRKSSNKYPALKLSRFLKQTDVID